MFIKNTTFRFLGCTASDDLKWMFGTDSAFTKAREVSVTRAAIIRYALHSSITVWFGSVTNQDILVALEPAEKLELYDCL